MRNIWIVLIVSTGAWLTSACSSSMSHRDRLSGPPSDQYDAGRGQHGREPQTVRYREPPVTRHDPVEPSRPYRSEARPGGCALEPVARRPFPSHVTVMRGDNLCRIATRYQTTVQAIVDVNRLPSPILPVGARLRLPSPEYYSQSPFGKLVRR